MSHHGTKSVLQRTIYIITLMLYKVNILERRLANLLLLGYFKHMNRVVSYHFVKQMRVSAKGAILGIDMAYLNS